jgi:hypothetical protein
MSLKHAVRFAVGLVAAGLVVAACTQDSIPSAPHDDPLRAQTTPVSQTIPVGLTVSGLVRCTPRAALEDSALLGPSGGVLRVGRNMLLVPGGALATPTMIRAVVPSDTVASIRLYPSGLRFQKAVLLKLSYFNCDTLGLTTRRLVYTNDALDVLEVHFANDRADRAFVRGHIRHFSRYAVGW